MKSSASELRNGAVPCQGDDGESVLLDVGGGIGPVAAVDALE